MMRRQRFGRRWSLAISRSDNGRGPEKLGKPRKALIRIADNYIKNTSMEGCLYANLLAIL
jgi:hypothetical protein